MGDESDPGGVTSAELTFLRAVLLFTWSLTEEIADAAGLSVRDAAEAATRLARCGALSGPPEDGLRPSFEDATSREHAARAAATPICALLLPGASGFEMGHWFADLVNAAYLFEPSAWSLAAECFAEESLRRTIGNSLAAECTLPALPPMLLVDHSRTTCSVCRLSVNPSEGRHLTVPGSGTPRRACGVVWTHYTIRARLAEANGWVGPDGEVRKRMDPHEELPGLEWVDP
jgi:hypothetical protein